MELTIAYCRPINTEYCWVLDLGFSIRTFWLWHGICVWIYVGPTSLRTVWNDLFGKPICEMNAGSVAGEQVCCFRVVFKWVCLRQLFLMARVPVDPGAPGFVWLEREHDGPNWLIPLLESGLGCGHALSKQKPHRSRYESAHACVCVCVVCVCVALTPEAIVRIHQQEVEEKHRWHLCHKMCTCK